MNAGPPDFGGILKMLAANKRTGTLQLEGDGFAADVNFLQGRIVNVETRTGVAWALGDILRELRLVPADRVDRALRQAVRKSIAPEQILVDREWVAISLLKKYRERLNLSVLMDLAVQTAFRAEFHPKESNQIVSFDWDAEIPVPYALREIARRVQSAVTSNLPVPPPDARFEKVPEAIGAILGGTGSEITQTGAGRVKLSASEKRVFFFCNGRVQFRNLPLVTGVPPEQAVSILHKLAMMNAIRLCNTPLRSEALSSAMRRGSRTLFGFLTMLLLVGMWGLVGLEVYTWQQSPSAYPPRPNDQAFYVESYGVSFRSVQDALYSYFVNEGIYPKKLATLARRKYIAAQALRPPVAAPRLKYTAIEQGLAYRLEQRVAGASGDTPKPGGKKEGEDDTKPEGGTKPNDAAPKTKARAAPAASGSGEGAKRPPAGDDAAAPADDAPAAKTAEPAADAPAGAAEKAPEAPAATEPTKEGGTEGAPPAGDQAAPPAKAKEAP